jgi:diguanylate cyclase (GGDEF)-like protein
VLVLIGEPALGERLALCVDDYFGEGAASRCTSIRALGDVDLFRVDLILCGDDFVDGNGFDAVKRVLARREGAPVVLVAPPGDSTKVGEAIRRGAMDVVLATPEMYSLVPMVIEKNMEIARIRQENRRLQAALSSSLSELKRKNRELSDAAARYEALATTDPLTGLANRRRLKERLSVMFAEALRYGYDLSCLMIDLDGFKAINDSVGHQRGDEMLTLAGRVIDEQIRVSDLGARYGGDEFIVILPHTNMETAAALAHRLRSGFSRRAAAGSPTGIRIGMSIGVSSVCKSRPLDPDMLIHHADLALYASKGRSEVMVCAGEGAVIPAPNLAA